jgi:hypothetical protein
VRSIENVSEQKKRQANGDSTRERKIEYFNALTDILKQYPGTKCLFLSATPVVNMYPTFIGLYKLFRNPQENNIIDILRKRMIFPTSDMLDIFPAEFRFMRDLDDAEGVTFKDLEYHGGDPSFDIPLCRTTNPLEAEIERIVNKVMATSKYKKIVICCYLLKLQNLLKDKVYITDDGRRVKIITVKAAMSKLILEGSIKEYNAIPADQPVIFIFTHFFNEGISLMYTHTYIDAQPLAVYSATHTIQALGRVRRRNSHTEGSIIKVYLLVSIDPETGAIPNRVQSSALKELQLRKVLHEIRINNPPQQYLYRLCKHCTIEVPENQTTTHRCPTAITQVSYDCHPINIENKLVEQSLKRPKELTMHRHSRFLISPYNHYVQAKTYQDILWTFGIPKSTTAPLHTVVNSGIIAQPHKIVDATFCQHSTIVHNRNIEASDNVIIKFIRDRKLGQFAYGTPVHFFSTRIKQKGQREVKKLLYRHTIRGHEYDICRMRYENNEDLQFQLRRGRLLTDNKELPKKVLRGALVHPYPKPIKRENVAVNHVELEGIYKLHPNKLEEYARANGLLCEINE